GIIALGLLIASFYLRSLDLRRASLIIFVILGLLVIPTYVTGAAAYWRIGGQESISRDLVAHHHDAAIFAFALMLITAWLAWLALWQYRRFSKPHAWVEPAVLIGGLLSLAALVRTGSRGGDINHPELVNTQTIADAAGASDTGLAASINEWVLEYAGIWPTMEAAHFMGMAVMFGVVILVVVRMFGLAQNVSYATFHRLLPLATLAFMINVITGMLFFVADSGRYTAMTNSFYPKMALIVIGGIAILYFTIFDKPWSLKPGDDAPALSKVIAGATVAIWTTVLIYGRLLPYLEGG
ncbi:MAG: hypothetical protein R3305_04170, partial [Gammaproteobacteria bacterium]|nr:hypothetical protein [Gammaproteobacteria bacterium]